jgi:hypothetical protein
MMELDRNPRIGRDLARKLREAGFRDVDHRVFNIPIGSWQRGKLVLSSLKAIFRCRNSRVRLSRVCKVRVPALPTSGHIVRDTPMLFEIFAHILKHQRTS